MRVLKTRLRSKVSHYDKDTFYKRIAPKPKQDLSEAKIFWYGDNFTAQVGFVQLVYFYGLEFTRILN